MNLYDFKVKTIDGKETTLAPYKGKALLIVNVASDCGFTPQYEGLERLHKELGAKGFEVLGFPCNQFGGQEPGEESAIQNFCTTKYSVTFPLFSKIDVNGANAHPLFEFLKNEEKGLLGTTGIKWNFTKFLVTPDGKVVKRFAPQTKPEALLADITAVLAK